MSPQEPSDETLTREELRLREDRERKKYWKRWGPYVAERQWGTGACFPAGGFGSSTTLILGVSV